MIPERAFLTTQQTFQVHIAEPYLRGGIHLYAIKTSMKLDPISISKVSSTSHRSLDDFILLYNQLLDEFPCLLIPDIISTVVNRFDIGEVIPAASLSDWLFDVLSGCRRGGTYVSTVVDMGQSKTMEVFLFNKQSSFAKAVELIKLEEEKMMKR